MRVFKPHTNSSWGTIIRVVRGGHLAVSSERLKERKHLKIHILPWEWYPITKQLWPKHQHAIDH